MKLTYNNRDWDKTDKAEVDLINKSLEVSQSPIMALDAPFDAARKLIIQLEEDARQGVLYECQAVKLRAIRDGFNKLADRVEKLPYVEII